MGDEQGGLFTAPGASTYFLKNNAEGEMKLTLFPEIKKPTIQYIRPSSIMKVSGFNLNQK